MPTNTPRWHALQLLNAMEARRVTLDALLDERRESIEALDRRDRALLQALVYGVLRWRSRLDAIIASCLSKPGHRMAPDIRNILRLGIFQLSSLDRIPPSAAVHTAVELTRETGKKPLAGFVNAVLRKAQREGVETLLSPSAADPASSLATAHAMPQWMAARWLKRFGPRDAHAFCEAMNTEAPLIGRVNTLKTTREAVRAALSAAGMNATPTPVSSDGLILADVNVPISRVPAISRGELRIQDEGAQLVTVLLDPQPGERILDACAGLGGKTGHIAQRMNNHGDVLAIDSDARRLKQLAGDMPQLGVSCVDTRCIDLNRPIPADAAAPFDRVLLDAPCSGMGVIRRNPDTKWSRRPEDLPRYAERQRRFLDHLAPLVKSSGVLVYAVCSLEPEENIEVIGDFLNHHPAFSLRPPPASLDFNRHGLVDENGCFQCTPHRHGMDGFFAATLIRKA